MATAGRARENRNAQRLHLTAVVLTSLGVSLLGCARPPPALPESAAKTEIARMLNELQIPVSAEKKEGLVSRADIANISLAETASGVTGAVVRANVEFKLKSAYDPAAPENQAIFTVLGSKPGAAGESRTVPLRFWFDRTGEEWRAATMLLELPMEFPISAGPKPEAIRGDVARFFHGIKTRWGFLDQKDYSFAEYFKVGDVAVQDRASQGTTCTVIASVSFKVLKDYVADNSLMSAGGWFRYVGTGGGKTGDVRKGDFKFRYERFEKGWRIQGLAD